VIPLVVALVLRAVFRVVDAAALARRRALWRAWWAGWRTLPSPYAIDGDRVARSHGLDPDDLVYGEAFVIVAAAILRAAGVGPSSVVVDLGCGRGAALVAARLLHASARGVDVCAAHIDVVRGVLAGAGAHADHGDARDVPLDDASHVWLAWATWHPATRALVSARLRTMRPGAIVVSVVHAVDDDAFVVVDRRRAPFSWGVADVVVQRRR
jgi:SAM-dependent methyltransferase